MAEPITLWADQGEEEFMVRLATPVEKIEDLKNTVEPVVNINQDSDLEEILDRIEVQLKTIESNEETADLKQNKLDLQWCCDIFDYINKSRHDIFLNMVQRALKLELDLGDVPFKEYVLKTLESKGEKDAAEKLRSRFREEPFKSWNKTPDIVHSEVEKFDYKLYVFDVAVTLDPKTTIENKYDKYKLCLDVGEPFKTVLGIIYFDMNERKPGQYMVPNKDMLNLDQVMVPKFNECVEKGERLKQKIKRYLPNDTLEQLNEWLKNSKYEDNMESLKVVEGEYGLNISEFINVIKINKQSKKFFYGLSDYHKELFIKALEYTAIKEDDQESIDGLAKFIKAESGYKKSDLETFFKDLKRKKFLEIAHHETENVPRPPTDEEVKKALNSLYMKSKTVYEPNEEMKLLYPFHFNFSRKTDLKNEERGVMLKKKRLERLYNMINNSDSRGPLRKALLLILKPSQVPDAIYKEEFLRGETYIWEDGTLCTQEEFMEEAKRWNRNYQRDTKNDELDPTGIEHFKEKRMAAVSYKKGEVISIKPSGMKEIRDLMSLAGVGRKNGIEDTTITTKNKIKSFPFWNSKKLNEACNELEEMTDNLRGILVTIGKKIDEKEFKEFKSISEELEESTETSGDESNSSTSQEEEEEKKAFDRGLKYFLRHNEILWENLSFVAHMGGNGFRIIQGITDNSFIIVLPCESILKGEVGVPFLNISIIEQGDLHFDNNDKNAIEMIGRNYKIKVSKGRRIDRPRLSGYLKVKPTYYTALSALNHLRIESKQDRFGMHEQVRLAMIIGNININTSSLLDNVRYMTENTMADYSFCKEFIEDKFMVPVKNHVQAFLFKRSTELLSSVRQETSDVRLSKAIVNPDGEVNIDTTRIVSGRFTSLIDTTVKYKKPEHLISEIYALFFSVPKGLHGNFHVLLDIHKTPLEIQRDINLKHKGKLAICDGLPKTRYEFDPEMMIITSLEADQNLTNSYRGIRNSFNVRERPNETPLRTKTTSSTRSTLIEDTSRRFISEGGTRDLESNPSLSEVSRDMIKLISASMIALENSVEKVSFHEAKKRFRNFKNEMKDVADRSDESTDGKFQLKDFMENRIKLNRDTRCLEHRTSMAKNDYKFKLINMFSQKEIPQPRFYTSGTVLTEVLNDVLKENLEENGKLESIAVKAKRSVMSPKKWKFAIRKKGQRTQKDREIFVVDLNAKLGLYIIEHMYKQKCTFISEEKISEPGDLKIISMESQVRSGFEWIAKEINKKNSDEANKNMIGSCFHFNLDMTKWAPKDNIFKFIFVVASSHVMTMKEKLYMFAVLFKMADKRMYVDEELMYRLSATSNRTIVDNMKGEVKDKSEDVFFEMTKGFTRNEVEISETWLQGQLNYLSSWVHAGSVLIWREFVKQAFSHTSFKFSMNVHSDDEQSSVYFVKPPHVDDDELMRGMWKMLDGIMVRCCMEISSKKSNVSKLFSQFVSQYNFGGEQIYLWIKPLMASISGCPYTTLKDDVSQTMSKMAEAASKGAPIRVINAAVSELKVHLWDLYGIRTKKMTNRFSEELGIPESMLPSCLGGMFIHDYTTLAIGGPKTQDQMTIMELLKQTGATTENGPKYPPNNATVIKAIKLFYIIDAMTSETLNEEEDISASISLNPFKPTRFKNKRTGVHDPFSNFYVGDKDETIKELKRENPGLGIMKPSDPQDLFRYYFILYNNSNFKASLAGQSPTVLHIHKIINRKKGVFRIKESGNIQLEKFKEERDKDTFTSNEVTDFLLKIIKKLDYGNEMAEVLLKKYITSDPEFKVLAFTSANAVSTQAILRKNPLPKRKPDPSDYSTIVNKLTYLLCYYFDEDYFRRNGFKIQYPTALTNDLIRLNEMFPVEFGWLRNYERGTAEELLKNPNSKRLRFNNYKKTVEDIVEIESNRIKLNRFIDYQDSIYRKDRNLADMIMRQEVSVGKGGESSKLTLDITGSQLKKEMDEFDIYSRLVNNSKVIDIKTLKVIFCSPTQSNELHEIALATKTIIESNADLSVGYYLTSNQKQELRGVRLNIVRAEKTEIVEFIAQLSNLVQLCHRLNLSKEGTRNIIKDAKYKNIDLGKALRSYKELPRIYKQALLLPIGLTNEKALSDYISIYEPLSIKWVVPQTKDNRNFVAEVRYENMLVKLQGKGNRINEMEIYYSKNLSIFFLNKAIHSFCSDLIHYNREKKVSISEFFELNKVSRDEQPKVFGYSSIKNEIVEGRDRFCNFAFKRTRVSKDPSAKLSTAINESVVNWESGNVMYNHSREDSDLIIRHRVFRDISINELEFEDTTIDHYFLSDLAKKSLYRGVMYRKFYDLTIDEVIRYCRNPEKICVSYGTFGCHFTFLLFIGNVSPLFDQLFSQVNDFITRFKVDRNSSSDESESESDSDENESAARSEQKRRERKRRRAKKANLVNYVNIDRYKSYATMLQTKMEDWESIMKYTLEFDLRSVRKSIAYINSIDTVEERRNEKKKKEEEETTTYDDMYENMVFPSNEEIAEKLKGMEENLTLLEKMIWESQVYKFKAADMRIFRSMCYILLMSRKEQKFRRLSKILQEVNDTESSSKARMTNMMNISVCCYMMGDDFLEFVDEIKLKKWSVEELYTIYKNEYKMNKRHLSKYTLVACDIFSTSIERAKNEVAKDSTDDFLEALQRKSGKKKNKKGKKNKEEKGAAKNEKKDSKSIRTVMRNYPELTSKSKEDPDALAEIADRSRYIESDTLRTTDFSGSETERAVRAMRESENITSLQDIVEGLSERKSIRVELTDESFEAAMANYSDSDFDDYGYD